MAWLYVLGLVIVVLDVGATWVVAKRQDLTRANRGYQLLFVWLVPFLGALVCIATARAELSAPDSPSDNTDRMFSEGDAGGHHGGDSH